MDPSPKIVKISMFVTLLRQVYHSTDDDTGTGGGEIEPRINGHSPLDVFTSTSVTFLVEVT